jgi:hypothetical protein
VPVAQKLCRCEYGFFTSSGMRVRSERYLATKRFNAACGALSTEYPGNGGKEAP